jgi:signal transduction histidine kinase
VFRIFQEILTNVARHAGARNVEINLRNENESLVLDVKDDGRGITEEEIKSPRALGILGMQERAQVCGGNLFIQRASGGGTSVTVKVPLA